MAALSPGTLPRSRQKRPGGDQDAAQKSTGQKWRGSICAHSIEAWYFDRISFHRKEEKLDVAVADADREKVPLSVPSEDVGFTQTQKV